MKYQGKHEVPKERRKSALKKHKYEEHEDRCPVHGAKIVEGDGENEERTKPTKDAAVTYLTSAPPKARKVDPGFRNRANQKNSEVS